MYMYSAMADLAAELGDASLKRACETLWADVMASKIYITSGLGPAAANEGFTEAYDLPNATAYAETCASVALIFWAQRMLHLDLDGRYADMLELALFNNALCGLSRDGEHYFYSNPLDSDGRHERWAWHTCPCCTMNASRLIASVGGYFVSAGDDTIALHLYGGISTTRRPRRRQGHPPRDQHLPLVRRDPRHGHPRARPPPSPSSSASPAGPAAPPPPSTAPPSTSPPPPATAISRSPAPGVPATRSPSTSRCRPSASTPTPPSPPTSAASRCAAARSSTASRKPTTPAPRCSASPCPATSALRPEPRDDLWPGVIALAADAERLADSDWNTTLYRPAPPQRAPAPLTAIPYFLWNNRTRGSMTVWIPEA